FLPLCEIPVNPADFVVLAVGIVVSSLGAPDLVAGGKHRDAVRQKESRQKIASLAASDLQNGGIARRTLDAAVPAPILVATVAVTFSIHLVVFLVIAHKVVQSETVVTGHEIHRRPGMPSVAAVEIARSGEAVREIAHHTVVTTPE